jgi:hypothetical protein
VPPELPVSSAAPGRAVPKRDRRQRIGSDDPRAFIAGDYRYPDGSKGAEIAIGDTRPKVIIGGNSAGKGRGIILRNALQRTGISQIFVDTRCQAGAVAAPWRRTVDDALALSLPEDAALRWYVDDARDSLFGVLGWFVGGVERKDFDEIILATDRLLEDGKAC